MSSSPTFKLSKEAKLLDAKAYKFVFSKANKAGDAFFTVLYRKNHLSHARLGVIVAKKNTKKAVDRNRIKRIIRESFRLKTELRTKAFDIIVLSKRMTTQQTNVRLFNSLDKIWQKIN